MHPQCPYRSKPCLRARPLSPLLRSLAGVTALVWIAAQVLCFVHCNFGGGHGDDLQPSCHGIASPPAHHDDGDSSGSSHNHSSGDVSCVTLKTALVNGSSLALTAPQLPVLYTLAPFALAFDATATEWAAPFTRQAGRDDWVFTPEVCLGPAFRSHAPPFLS